MSQFPRKALQRSQFPPKGLGQAVGNSCNKVERVEFRDYDGKVKTGFFKPISADYPPLLEQIAVAASQFTCLALGGRAADDRLVLNDKTGEIEGTVSIGIEGFKPIETPSKETLLEENIAELLVAFWSKMNDDAHPGNIGLKGLIDFDMFFYNITYILKGGRWSEGVINAKPEDSAQLLSMHLNELLVDDNGLQKTHWPSRSWPANVNLAKRCLAYGAFRELKASPQFQEQVFAALLKELCVYDPVLLKKRLVDCFGDLKPDTRLLTPEVLKTLQEKYPGLVDSNKSFVDSISEIFQENYDRLYRVAVFYEGCKANSLGAKVNDFNTYLADHPDAENTLLGWVKKENQRLGGQSDKEALYLEETVKNRYHQIWRDSHTKQIAEISSELRDIIDGLNKTFSLSNRNSTPSGSLTESFNKTYERVNESSQLLSTIFPVIDNPLKDCRDDNKDKKALSKLYDFYEGLRFAFEKYYNEKALRLESHTSLYQEISILNITYHGELLGLLSQGHPDRNNKISPLCEKIEELAKKINLQLHLYTERRVVSTGAISKKQTDEDVITTCLETLFEWADKVERKTLNELIKKVLAEKYNTWSGSNRKEPIEKYLQTTTEKGRDILGKIFSEGGCETNSLNTKLVKVLLKSALETKGYSPMTEPASLALQENRLEAARYAVSAQEYAREHDSFNHINSKNINTTFNTIIYKWVDRIDKKKLSNVIDDAAKVYNGYTGFFGDRGRVRQIKDHLRLERPNAYILGLIISEGDTQATSFNKYLLDIIIREMKQEVNGKPVNQFGEEDSLISQFCDQPKAQQVLLQSLPKYAKDVTHRPEMNKKSKDEMKV